MPVQTDSIRVLCDRHQLFGKLSWIQSILEMFHVEPLCTQGVVDFDEGEDLRIIESRLKRLCNERRRSPRRKMPMALLIDELNLSTRVNYLLTENGVFFVGQLTKMSEEELRAIKGLGDNAITYIRAGLASMKLKGVPLHLRDPRRRLGPRIRGWRPPKHLTLSEIYRLLRCRGRGEEDL